MGNLMQGHHSQGHGGAMMPMWVPAPMAVVGVVVSFMLGAMIGMRCADRGSKMRRMGAGPMPWMHGMGGPKPPWMTGGMSGASGPWMPMAHHHHGYGAPGCCESHGAHEGSTAEPEPDEVPEGD